MQVFVVGSFVVACSVKVARLPRAGESLTASAFVAEPGGKGFNLALALHRLGVKVDGAFAIGDDAFAAVARQAFGRAGLSPGMLVPQVGPTGAGIGFIDEAGENCLAVSLGANEKLDGGDVMGAAGLGPGGICLATFEAPDAAIGEAFAQARSRGATTLLNASPSRTVRSDILERCDILVVNEVEATALGLRPRCPDGARPDALRDHPSTVVVTLGADGAVALRPNLPASRQSAYPVAVIDTIGAGDAFTAGLAAGLLEGGALEEALRMAAACGALAAATLGTFDAFPTRSERDTFMAARPAVP